MKTKSSLIIKKVVERSRDVIASLLFPTRCPICDGILEPEEIKNGIHSICESKIYPVTGSVCMHCGKLLVTKGWQAQKSQQKFQDKEPLIEYLELSAAQELCYDCAHLRLSYITQAKSLYIYRGAIKHTMYKFKYSNKREYARFFAQQAVECLGWWLGVAPQHTSESPLFDIIIPVPMFESKKRARGYNQAESFARELSRVTGIPVDDDLVIRVKDTTPQKELNPQERKNNLKSAFQTRKNSVQYNHALVVDDIYTTGSTAEAVAEELIKKGVRQVYVLTVCIGVDI